MIEKKTVLVLGAGASQYYGYPSGRELVRIILHFLNKSNVENWIERLINEYGIINRDYISSFSNELFNSGIMSIDEFLEYRPEFIKIGKLLIALALIPYEDNSRLFDLNKRDQSWYEYLLNKLRSPKTEFKNNSLSIITFNYDRSLEQYFFTALKSTYGIEDAECAEIVKSIPIIHVYGILDWLPWQIEGGRSYDNHFYPNQIKKAADSIIIMSEDRDRSAEFDQAFKLLKEAEAGYFLGFGYHDMNLKRLRINKANKIFFKQVPNKQTIPNCRQFYGTSFGLGNSEIDSIQRKWPIIKIIEKDKNVSIMDFFKNYVHWR